MYIPSVVQCSRKRVQQLKNAESYLLDLKKCLKNLVRLLNHSTFSTQLPKVGTGKSPTSNILLRNADTKTMHPEKCVWFTSTFLSTFTFSNGSE